MMSNGWSRGYSLLEAIVALLVLLIGLLGTMALMAKSMEVEQRNSMFKVALNILTHSAERISGFGFTKLLNGLPSDYVENYGNLDQTYRNAVSGVDTTCSSPYEECGYKGYSIIQKIGSDNVTRYFIEKLMLDYNYIGLATLMRCKASVYWTDRGINRKKEVVFYVRKR